MIRIAICDDEKIFLDFIHIKIRTMLNKFAEQYQLDVFNNGTELLENCIKYGYDLIFLDIDMPELSGFDVSEHLKKNKIFTTLIFISGRDNFVFQSIKYRPFRFIRKTHIELELREAIIDFFNSYVAKKNLYTFLCKDYSLTVSIPSITYFESYDHDLIMHMENNTTYNLNRQYNLSDFEQQFMHNGFIRVHKSFLVNYRHITLIKNTDIIMKNQDVIPSSKQRLSAVKSLFAKYMLEDL